MTPPCPLPVSNRPHLVRHHSCSTPKLNPQKKKSPEKLLKLLCLRLYEPVWRICFFCGSPFDERPPQRCVPRGDSQIAKGEGGGEGGSHTPILSPPPSPPPPTQQMQQSVAGAVAGAGAKVNELRTTVSTRAGQVGELAAERRQLYSGYLPHPLSAQLFVSCVAGSCAAVVRTACPCTACPLAADYLPPPTLVFGCHMCLQAVVCVMARRGGAEERGLSRTRHSRIRLQQLRLGVDGLHSVFQCMGCLTAFGGLMQVDDGADGDASCGCGGRCGLLPCPQSTRPGLLLTMDDSLCPTRVDSLSKGMSLCQ